MAAVGVALLTAVAVGLPTSASAQLFELPASGDTYLKSGQPNKSRGGDTFLRLQSSGKNRSLVQFDSATIASSVGSGRLVTATLRLFVEDNANNWSSDGRTLDAHRVLEAWTEDGATWNCGIDTNPSNSSPDCDPQWNGGTFEEEPTDTLLITNGLTGWIELDVTGDVAAALAGEAHHGWLVKKTEEGQSGRVEFTSREGTAGQAPTLTLLVETPGADVVAPEVAITSPSQSILVNDPQPTIVVEYSDHGDGLDLATLEVSVDGADIASGCAVDTASATCTPPTLAAGEHEIVARVADLAGNLGEATFDFELLLGAGMHSATFTAGADTYLKQGTPNQSQGSEPRMRVRSSGHNRALVRFDPAEIAAVVGTATLLDATLRLYAEENGRNWGPDGRTVDAHRLTEDWVEGAATWACGEDEDLGNQQADCPSPWQGGAFAATPTASVLHTKELLGWVEYDVTADVATFLAGTADYGWLIKKTSEGASGRVEYTTREGAAEFAPQLIATFESSAGSDVDPPLVTLVVPSETLLASPPGEIVLTYSDSGSGVDLQNVQLVIDGLDRTSEAEIQPSGVSYSPSFAFGDGSHSIGAVVSDLAGNGALGEWSFVVDTTPPDFEITTPRVIQGDASPEIGLQYEDLTSGVDLASLIVSVDGIELICDPQPEAAVCTASSLTDGPHTIVATIDDLAGNSRVIEAELDVILDSDGPLVSIVSPSEPVIVNESVVAIVVSYTDLGRGVDPTSLDVRVDGTPVTSTCQIGTDLAECSSIPLAVGPHTIDASINDTVGNSGSASFQLEAQFDRTPPMLLVVSPEPLVVGDRTPLIVLAYSDAATAIDSTSLALSLDGADILGSCQIEPMEATCEAPELERGEHRLVVSVADDHGNAASLTYDFILSLPLEIAITEPEPSLVLEDAVVRVAGTVSEEAVRVTVNGVGAQVGGGAFSLEGLALHEGVNNVVAVAEDGSGNVGRDVVQVTVDLTPPYLSVSFPEEGATVSSPSVTVSGLVNDISIGTTNEASVSVTVDGVPATVMHRTFALPGVPLDPGPNVLTVVALDRVGNYAVQEVSVTRVVPNGAHLRAVAGDGQVGTIQAQLPGPLVVEAVDDFGQPLASQPVVFRVVRGDGTFASGSRAVVATTDGTGWASAPWVLGTRAGAGAHRVRATATGIDGEVGFTASALPGEPVLIHVASGDNQRGFVGESLALPLRAVVFDAGGNPVADAPVAFRVVSGDGQVDEGSEVLATTDPSGLAETRLTLGVEPGLDNNLVEARVEGATGRPAYFRASSFVPGDPADTAISGVVHDNQGDPVPGVTVSLLTGPQTTVTDENGYFRLAEGIPVGRVFLEVDGSTATRPGVWASLEFEVFTLAGVDNTLERPIYLLPLAVEDGLYVSELAGGTLTLPDLPGFSLEVAPGSVTFADGSHSGVVSVTAVHADRIPMPPGSGMQPRLIVTIQPAGAEFDPPAPITFPNVDGLAPRRVTELFSFDHDIGAFVSIGTGTVSEDATVIRSDPGFGIIKAGWHCGAPPSSRGDAGAQSMTMPEGPVYLCAENDPPDTTVVAAILRHALDAAYSIGHSGNAISLNPEGQAQCNGDEPIELCPNGASCGTLVTAVEPGRATVTADGLCCTTGVVTSAQTEVVVVGLDFEIQGLTPEQIADQGPMIPVNGDNDDADDELDRNQDGPLAEEDDLVPLRLILDPADLERGIVTLRRSNANVRVWGAEDKTLPILADSFERSWDLSQPVQRIQFNGFREHLFVEGVNPSAAARDTLIEAILEDGDFRCEQVLALTVLEVDIDVDSDNDQAFDPPARTVLEEIVEDIEADPERPGKYVPVNHDDSDGDFVTDYGDGFDRDGTAGNEDDGNVEEDFMPVVLSLSDAVDLAVARVRISYDDSDPSSVTSAVVDGFAELSKGAGALRVWTIDGDQAREPEPMTIGGDYVPPGEYSPEELGLTAAGRSRTLYLEAVHWSDDVGDEAVTVELDPDGEGPQGFLVADTVRLTSLALLVEDENGVIEGGEVSWITSEPEMPQLAASFRPSTVEGLSFTCHLQFDYDRTAGGTRPQARVRPHPGDLIRHPPVPSTDFAIGPADTLDLWNEIFFFPDEIRFFGGDGFLECAGGPPRFLQDFRVRGRNPEDPAARAFLDSHVAARSLPHLWYIYAVAKSETREGSTRYNHFNEIGRPLQGQPNYGAPDGWGLLQVDLSFSDRDGPAMYLAPRGLWDWRANAEKGVEILRLKYLGHKGSREWLNSINGRRDDEEEECRDFPNGQRPQSAIDTQNSGWNLIGEYPGCQGEWDPLSPAPVPEALDDEERHNCTFSEDETGNLTFEDGVAIKQYNGAEINWLQWNRDELRWVFNDAGPILNYVNHVCEEIDNP